MKNIKHVDWRATAIFIVVIAIGGYLGSRWFNIPYWIAMCVAALALLVNGLIAIVEDRKSF